ncbi:MAG: hypothetical protein LBQ61_10150 [Spirochaetales bacterium]|jgi:hypothetical protein|nr:hypothetical protein [Spirochaetales bacterium]
MSFLERFLAALYIAFMVSGVLNLTLGGTGFGEYRRLRVYRETLLLNLKELEALHLRLSEKALALRTDRAPVILEARELDYYTENEGIILLPGDENPRRSYSMGRILQWSRVPENRDPLFRALTISAGLIVFVLCTFIPGGGLTSRRSVNLKTYTLQNQPDSGPAD